MGAQTGLTGFPLIHKRLSAAVVAPLLSVFIVVLSVVVVGLSCLILFLWGDWPLFCLVLGLGYLEILGPDSVS